MRKHYKYSNFDWFQMCDWYYIISETVFIGSSGGFIAEEFVSLYERINEGGHIQNNL